MSMHPLFSKKSLPILEALTFTKTLYAFDFDGTLSKIVKEPTSARFSDGTEELLRRLSEVAPVAVVSGRSLSDLRQRLSFKPQYMVGNHGLEGIGIPKSSLESARRVAARWKEQLLALGIRQDRLPGVEIDDKQYSLAIHYRQSRQKRRAFELIRAAIARLEPSPRVIPGKSVVNLLPAGAPHKGVAVLELMKKAQVGHFFYIGDDDTDEDVFGLPEGELAVTVRVGRKRSSHARYFIERQSQINRTLQTLLRFYGKE
jgi:trehalose 6-phosphate phosphatase